MRSNDFYWIIIGTLIVVVSYLYERNYEKRFEIKMLKKDLSICEYWRSIKKNKR